MQSFLKLDAELLCKSHEALDHGPVDHSPIPGDGVEIQVSIKIIRSPPGP